MEIMNLRNILKKALNLDQQKIPDQFVPTPKDTLTHSDEKQLSELQKLLPEAREFLMYEEDSVIQVVFSAKPNLSNNRLTTLKDYGFSVLTQYTCKCCGIDYVMIITKYV